MTIIAELLGAALITTFVQNSVFDRALGVNVLLYASRRRGSLIGFFLGILYITTLSSVITYFVDTAMVNVPFYNVLMPIIYVGIVSVIYIASLLAVWKFLPKLFGNIRKYVHLSVFNCSVLGALFLNTQYGADIWGYIGYGIGTGAGFLLASYLLYIGGKKLNSQLVPAAFKGLPVMLMYIGILALAFYGFIGYTTTI